MSMLQLNDLLPQSEATPYWTFYGADYDEFPNNKEYVVFEYYCSIHACDCQHLVAEIMTTDAADAGQTKPLAIIDYKWGDPKTRCKPKLHKDSARTKTADNILDVYTQFIHTDEYVERIKNDYQRVKELANNPPRDDHPLPYINPTKKKGRNDPCACGSGKKYKKCCLMIES